MLKRLAALSFPLFACVGADDPGEVQLIGDELPPEVRLVGDDSDQLFGAHEIGTGWDKELIEVCWEASAYSNDPDKEALMSAARMWVENAVKSEWGKVSRLEMFPVWVSCSSGYNRDIRIGHHEVDGWSAFGTEARDIATGPTMEINLLGPAASTCVPGGGGGGGGGGFIPQCNGTLLGADPASRENWTTALGLHLFGYALGLRKEDAHPDSPPCGGFEEALDENGNDGEPLWSFDSASVMSACRLTSLAYGSVRPTLSVGDIRSINSLYPGAVRMFAGTDLAGTSWPLGPGYFTRTTHPALASVSSMVIPPGFRARICTSSVCTTYTASRRTLTSTYDNQIQNVQITLWGYAAEQPGFIGASQWFSPGTYKASQGHLATVGNNAISSAFVPPGQAITLCDSETPGPLSCISAVGGALGVPALIKLLGAPQNQFSGWGMDNTASYVKVTPRVVTYSSTDFRGTSYSVATGTYTVSGGSTYLSSVRALSVPAGLEATVCNSENQFPRPTCQTLVQSGPLSAALQGNVKRLEVRVPLVSSP